MNSRSSIGQDNHDVTENGDPAPVAASGPEVGPAGEAQTYKCRACGEAFPEVDALITHLSVHTEQPKGTDFIDLTDEPPGGQVKKETTGHTEAVCTTSGDDTVRHDENQNENNLCQNGLGEPVAASVEQWQTSAGFEHHFVQSNNQGVNPAWEQAQNTTGPQPAVQNYSQYNQSTNYGPSVMTPTSQHFHLPTGAGSSHPYGRNMGGGQQNYQAQVAQQGYTQNPYAAQQAYTQNPYPGQHGFSQYPHQQNFNQNPYALQHSFSQNQYPNQQGFGQNLPNIVQSFSHNANPVQHGFNNNPNPVQENYSQNRYPVGEQGFSHNPYLSTNGNQPPMSAHQEYQPHMGANMTGYGTESGNHVPNTDEKPFPGGVWGEGQVSQPPEGGGWQLTVSGEEKPYKCHVCGVSFKLQPNLDAHMTLHAGRGPYCCTVCSRTFKDKKSLGQHTGVHTGETPFECKECGKGFKIKGHVRLHMIVHSEERPFECVVCRKFYKTTGALAGHMRTHAVQQ